MARLLPSISNHSHLPFFSIHFTPFIASIAALFSILALVIFLCASSSRKPKKSNRMTMQRNFVSKINSNISSRAISMAKMISWRKVEAADEDEEEQEEKRDCDVSSSDDVEEVWRKTIIKGERCRPLEFSGKIDYDSEGNLLSDSKRNSKSVG